MKKLSEMTSDELRKLLNARQINFVEALMKHDNATEAAIAAGYSPKSAASQASRLLKDDKVAAYRRARYIDLYSTEGVTPEWVGLQLIEITKRCMDAEPHMTWDSDRHEWVPDGTWCFDARGATTALTAIGKSLGMFADKKNGEKPAGESVEEFLAKMDGGRKF